MKAASVIFPHQLFLPHPGLSKKTEVFLIEHPLFFFDDRLKVRFHKKKLMLHRAAMQAYKDKLVLQGHAVHYMDYGPESSLSSLIDALKRKDVSSIRIADVVDIQLEKRIKDVTKGHNILVEWLPTPCFLTPKK